MGRLDSNVVGTVLGIESSELLNRVELLARKSTQGTLTEVERVEYEQIILLNDLMAIVNLKNR